MNAPNVMIIMALLIIGTWITLAPKDLPIETFNITVNGETRYYTQIKQGECARHISSARAMLEVFYTTTEIQQLMSSGAIEIKCIEQHTGIDIDNLINSDDPSTN